MTVLRYADVFVAVLGAIVAIIVGAPALGCALGAGGWVLARIVQANESLFLTRIEAPTRRAGTRLFVAFGRIWLLAGAIVIAAVAGQRKDGLAAAVTIFVVYSVAFLIRLTGGPPELGDTTA